MYIYRTGLLKQNKCLTGFLGFLAALNSLVNKIGDMLKTFNVNHSGEIMRRFILWEKKNPP